MCSSTPATEPIQRGTGADDGCRGVQPRCLLLYGVPLRSARSPLVGRAAGGQNAQRWQSTATARATQTCSIRRSLRRPSRSTRTPVDTLSTESRLTADRRGTGSSPGSSTTSLGRSRMIVVHGPISVRRSRGIAASRERTTTGRRPMSGSSHHQSSPRAGTGVTTSQLRHGTKRGLPTHLVHRVGGRRRWRTPSRSLPPGWPERVRREQRRTTPSRSHPLGGLGLRRVGRHRQWC